MTRVLVTGAAGFLGSHLVDALLARGDEVIAIDNLRRGRLEHLQPHLAADRLDFREADIRDFDAVKQAVSGVATVFHLAAQSNVMGAMSDPDYSFTTNVVGTYNVLRASAEAGLSKLVFSSSREAYGEPSSIPVSEGALPQPKNPYGASKLAGEAYCRAFDGTSGLSCTVLRFGNLYGSRDRDRVIPIWLERAVAGESLKLYGGEQVLDFFHSERAVKALLAAERYQGFGPINVASGAGTTLKELARRVVQATHSTSTIEIEPARSIEVTRFVADVALMRRELGLEPAVDPLEGLESMARDARLAAPAQELTAAS